MEQFKELHPPMKPFRAFVTRRYFENRDEYETYNQKQPHTFKEYVWANMSQLRKEYRLTHSQSGAILYITIRAKGKQMKLAYCDRIAAAIREALVKSDPTGIIGPVGPIKMDLDPVGGYFVSPKKTMLVWDMNGKAYSVTVEEQPMMDLEDNGKKEVDNLAL